jgi:hypothetical protein
LFTWLDEGGMRTGDILSIIATRIGHDINPRAHLHRVAHDRTALREREAFAGRRTKTAHGTRELARRALDGAIGRPVFAHRLAPARDRGEDDSQGTHARWVRGRPDAFRAGGPAKARAHDLALRPE